MAASFAKLFTPAKMAVAGLVGGGAMFACSDEAAHARCQFATYGGQFMFPASSNFPDLSKHNNWMSKILTPEVGRHG